MAAAAQRIRPGVYENSPRARIERAANRPTRTLWFSFWARVDCVGSCWIWRGAVDRRGRGVFFVGAAMMPAADIAWAYDNGPEAQLGLPECGNRLCVKPSHATPAEVTRG